MDPTTLSLMLARDLVRVMLNRHVDKLVVEADSPDELKALAERLTQQAGDDAVKTWVFTDRDLETPTRTLSIHRNPWGPIEATLSTLAPEPEQTRANAAIKALGDVKF